MANQVIGTSESTAIIPEVWSAKFYEVLRAKLPFIESVSRDYEGEIQSMGDIVNISTVADFDEATELAEGAAGEADVTSVTGQQLVINKRPYKDFIVTKKSQLQSLPYMDSLRDSAIYSVMKRMQQLIIDEIVPSAATPDHSITYDAGTTLALADVLEAKELLDAQNVEEEMRVGVLGSAQMNDVFNITGYTSSDFRPAGSPSPLSSGMFAFPLAGFQIKGTTVVGTTSYWFHPSFLTMAVQDQLNISVYDMGVEGVRAARVNVDLLMGVKQLDNLRVVTIA